MVRCEFDGHDTPKWIYPQEREKVNETHDWDTKSIDVRHLNGTHILVGESGGLSAVYNHAQSVGSSEMWAVETEHGTLVFAAQQVDILDLDSDQ
jgi:hypothetical protein